MLKKAVAKTEKFKISRYEISRKGVSYTIETLQKFRKRFPSAELILIIGSDSRNRSLHGRMRIKLSG